MKQAAHTVAQLPTQSDRANRRFATIQVMVRCCLLLLLGSFAPRLTYGAGANYPSVTSTAPGLPFAIADFDGDHRPDFAAVQTGRDVSSTGNYWIRLQLSASGKSYIRVSAPKGGLLVEARDVNGDHAVDLVFATPWLHRPVAILINDGHGNFSQADPAAFPEAFAQSTRRWDGVSSPFFDVIGIPRRSSTVVPSVNHLSHRRADADWLRFTNAVFFFDSFLASRAARAPPSNIAS